MAKKDAAAEVLFMGQPVEVVGKDGVFKVSNASKATIMNELGVTPEVQKLVKKANRDVQFAALDFVGTRTVETDARVRLELGAGSQMTSFTMTPEAERRDPSTGKALTVFGSFKVHHAGISPGDAEFVAAHDKFRDQIKKNRKK